jgi:hypothetical protein
MIRRCQQKFNRWAAAFFGNKVRPHSNDHSPDHTPDRRPACDAASSTQSRQIHAVADGLLCHVPPSPPARLPQDRTTLADSELKFAAGQYFG